MKLRSLEDRLDHCHYDSFKDFTYKGNLIITFLTDLNGRVDYVEATLVIGSGPEMYKTGSPSKKYAAVV